MRSVAPFALLLAIFLAETSSAEAGNWPRYRGPNGTGTADDKDLPVEWSEKNFLWKLTLPGPGNSSPIVWGDKIFIQAASEDGKQRMMVCASTAGKQLWSTPLPGVVGHTHDKNTLASSTPATDGERVYGYFWDGKGVSLVAFDFKGAILWQRPLGDFTSQHGAGASPVVWEDLVFVNNDQDGKADLLAFEAKTGQPAWSVKRKDYRASYASPFVLERSGAAAELIVGSSAGITSYNPKSGAENWAWVWSWAGAKQPMRMVSSPIFADGLIFGTTGEGAGGSHAIAVKAEGKGDVTKTNLAWEKKKDMPYVPSLLASGEHLFYVTDTGVAGCITAKTGKEVWLKRLPGSSKVTSSPVMADGKIYSIREDGSVVVFAASKDDLKVLARNTIPEGVMATPAVADNRMYVRSRTTLYCIGKAEK
jgi:outer membrane protein assembly factor BamB